MRRRGPRRPRATPTTCRRSAPRSSRSSARASTPEQARSVGAAGSWTAAILDIDGTLVDTNYHHAVAWYRAFRAARVRAAAVADPPPHRHGRRPAGRRPRRRGASTRSTATTSARREGALHGADRRGRAARGRARADRGPQGRGHTVVLASSAKPDEVEHYLDLLDARDARRRLDRLGRRRARPSPSPTSSLAAVEKAGGERRGDGRRLDLGLRGRQARRHPVGRRADGRLQRGRAAAKPARRRVYRVDSSS